MELTMSQANEITPAAKRVAEPPAPRYQIGFGNDLESEALAGALPRGRSSPQVPAYGLVDELISGVTFSAPRALNRRVHVYRIRPSVSQLALTPMKDGPPLYKTAPFERMPDPNQMRWSPFEIPERPLDFLDGINTLFGNGSAMTQYGMAMHVYVANRSMQGRAFSNADGEMLLLPQLGRLRLVTELGILDVRPGELALVPRGMKFRVDLLDDVARGFVCENYGLPFRLPELGLIGSTGQANAYDFEVPVAAYEDADVSTQLVHKYCGAFWSRTLAYSPFDVVAWRGNNTPSKFDMAKFMILGALAFDHPDPSIYCALSSPSDVVGGPNAELMILPPRWLVIEDTFRPPTFHRNCVAEFLALLVGEHQGKSADAFRPGGASMHNNWAPHGPDMTSFTAARAEKQTPIKLTDTLVVMVESRYPFQLTDSGFNAPERQRDYIQCWNGHENAFRASQKP
jgi:homogentisate 1,2-dioxygenase